MTRDTRNLTISGTIVDALDGTPLEKARVSLADTTNRAAAISVVTADGGRFEFTHLKAGKFSLQGAKRGFLTAAYDQHEAYSTAIVTGTGLNTEHLVLRLTPLAMLSGKVLDESGEPIRNAQVSLFREFQAGGFERIIHAAKTQSTDDLGSYEFPSLPPGNYFVSAAAKPWYAVHPPASQAPSIPPPQVPPALDVAYPTTYYSGATDSAMAIPIVVKGGSHLQIDLQLSPVPSLHLLFRTSNPEESFRAPIFEKHVFDSQEFVIPEDTRPVAPGVFEVTGIPAGKYLVHQRDNDSDKFFRSGELDLVADGQELDEAVVEPTGSVKFLLKLVRTEPLPKQLSVAIQDPRRRQLMASRNVDSDGSATFPNLYPGKYAVFVWNNERAFSVVRSLSQGIEKEGHDLEVSSGSARDVTLFLAGSTVSVEGIAKRGGKGVPGAMVVLVPKDPVSHPELFRRDQSDLDGSFSLRGVIPGTYTVVAIEDGWNTPWLQSGALDRYLPNGQAISISDLASGTLQLRAPILVQPH